MILARASTHLNPALTNTTSCCIISHLIASDVLHFLDDLRLLLGAVQVGHVTCVEDHADIFHERLILDLTVREQEHRLSTVTTRLQ